MTSIRSICVYCGSSRGAEAVFEHAAQELGQAIAQAQIALVYGGGNVGLMGTVARAVLAGGGYVSGIIPAFLKTKERMLDEVQDLIITADMHERKRVMFEKSDAFVALPGGIGTLEELIEMMTWAQLGQHNKPILIANIAGFWNPLLDLLAHMQQSGFIRPGLEVHTLVANSVADIIPMLQHSAKQSGAKTTLSAPM
jgi:uncharacterized protein (TIGR00730 family)